MTTRHVGGSLAALLLAAGTLASCTTENPGSTGARPDLLSKSDVGDVRSSESFDKNASGYTGCGRLDGFEDLYDTSEPDTVGRSFVTAKDERVVSSLLGRPLNRDSTAAAVSYVDDSINECLTRPTPTVKRLTGLPAGAVGFRSAQTTSNGDTTTERAYARISDRRIVVVTVQRTNGAPLTKSVVDLLPVAIKRATSS